MENNNKNKGPNKNRQGWGIILFTTLLVTFCCYGPIFYDAGRKRF